MKNNFLPQKRRKIDSIDSAIISALQERFQITDEIGKYKAKNNIPITNRKREEEILQLLQNKVKEADKVDPIITIYKVILKESKKRQRKSLTK